MYARAVRFTGVGPETIANVRAEVESSDGPPPGVTATSMKMLYDADQGTSLFIAFFETEEDMATADEIFEAMRDLPKVCEYLHLPAQSGSNSVLKRMKRQYSVEVYEELLARGREFVPNMTIASDFIVGFCGETEAEFEESLALMERIRFKNIFCFKYSPRPNTVADKGMTDDVPDAVKRDRNRRMLETQERISLAQTQAMIGETVEILVEGYSKAAIKAQEAEQTRGEEVSWRRSDQLVGRTSSDRIVVFCGDESYIGSLAKIKINGATSLTLFGDPVDKPNKQAHRIAEATELAVQSSQMSPVRRGENGGISISISG